MHMFIYINICGFIPKDKSLYEIRVLKFNFPPLRPIVSR